MKNLVFIIVVVAVSGLTNISNGQTLSDWQNALSIAKSNMSNSRWAGLSSIPYDNIRQTAESEQSILEDLKLVKYACEEREHGTRSIRNSIKEKEENLSKASNDSDKTKINEEINKQKELLQDMIQKAQQRTDFAQKVVEARRKVREQVQNAINNARDEDDPDIKPIAQELADYWEDDRIFHAEAILNAEQAVLNCKACGEGQL